MSDVSQATPGSAEAIERTPMGEIKNQPSTSTETPTPTPEPKPTEPAEPASLLNEKDEEPKGAPEKYDLKLPEGSAIDEKVMNEATGIFKELGLNNKGAQRLVDFYNTRMQEIADAPMKTWIDTQKAWQDEIKTDPEIGRKLPEVRNTVAKAIDSLGDPKLAAEFRKAMDFTGVGNNPAFVKAFYKLAQNVVEGKAVSGAGPSKFGQQAPGATERPSAAKALYPNNP